MSGIFGFTYTAAKKDVLDSAVGGLEYWNRVFGDSDHGVSVFDGTGIGCHVEHFSEQFPYGGPILHFHESPSVVDALIYNRTELLSMLSMSLDSCISDEELLLRLIDERGFRALEYVNGDFAGAIFNAEKQEWILFRDHMGVRPLYYYIDHEKIVFSTDLRGVVSAPGVDRTVNSKYIFEYAQGVSYLSQTRTEYENIRCIHPGSITRLSIRKGKESVRQKLYWKVRRRKIRLGSDEEYIEQMRELVTDAVHRRCDAIPGLLGAELSGGLDSCTIDIILNRHKRDAVYFSWCFSPERLPLVEGDDERKIIMDVCNQENITCRFIEQGDNFHFAEQLAAHVPPFVNTPQLVSGSRWIREQGARVVFSGHGGDEGVSHRASPFELLCNLELFSYFKIHWMYLNGKKLRLLRTIWSGLQEAKLKIPQNFFRVPKEFLQTDVFNEEFTKRMLSECSLKLTPFCYAPHKYVRQGGSRYRLETCAFMGAYSGVRYLFPYIDYRVMDFAVSIPRRLHVNHEINRLIFRQAFADILPTSLRELRYKDLPSFRNTHHVTYRHTQVKNTLEHLLKKLDPDIWDGILDFDRMRAVCDKDDYTNDEIRSLCYQTSKLSKLLFIQDIQQNAPRWRELDAQNV